LNDLVDKGNTVVVIEHNPDVIKSADHIIDLGPEGGDDGGWVVAQGTPRQVAESRDSKTGAFLKQIFNKNNQ
jgi:excinuclease ABC subunit A